MLLIAPSMFDGASSFLKGGCAMMPLSLIYTQVAVSLEAARPRYLFINRHERMQYTVALAQWYADVSAVADAFGYVDVQFDRTLFLHECGWRNSI